MANVSSIMYTVLITFCVFPLFYLIRFISRKNFLKFWEPNYISTKIFYFKFYETFISNFLLFLLIVTTKQHNFSKYNFKPTIIFIFLFFFFLLLFFFFFLVKNRKNDHELDNLLGISFWFSLAFLSFIFTTDFINFLFNVELIGTLYFFFFLSYFDNNYVNLLKFKNMISNYLFTSFFTLISLAFVFVFLILYGGTLSFKQLKHLSVDLPVLIKLLVLVGFFWKIGSAGFYFFKLEIYKILPTYSLIFFSIINFFLTSFVLLFFFSQAFYFFISCNYIILIFLLIYNIFIIFQGFSINSLSQFLGLSAINSWTLILLFCLAKIFRFFLLNYYTTEKYLDKRVFTNTQICYKKDLNFLRLKKTLTSSISNRLVIRSGYYKSFIMLQRYYVNFLRFLFCPLQLKTSHYDLYNFDKKDFLLNYFNSKIFRNFDQTLFWKASQINSLFNVKNEIKKKRKKLHYKQHVYFIPNHKRLLFVWKWFKIFVNANSMKNTPHIYSWLFSFENFLFAPKETHCVVLYKYEIYKLYLIRNV